jgi:hypothetical protein
MIPKPERYKRTTPFVDQCQFMMDLGTKKPVQCKESADYGLYFSTQAFTGMISMCIYHTINQESLWAGEKHE